MLCMVLDKMVLDNPLFLVTEGCEIMARRVLALKKAFMEVKQESDWRQPKGAASSKWESKVRWDLTEHIDRRRIREDSDFSMPQLEQEISERLQQKVLMNKYLGKASEGAKAMEEP